MPSTSVDLLGSFKLNHWYKLAIYIGAVLIILGFVFVNNSNVGQYNHFAIESLVLGLVVWMLDDTLGVVGNWRIDVAYSDHAKNDIAKNAMGAIYIVRWAGLIIWIWVILNFI